MPTYQQAGIALLIIVDIMADVVIDRIVLLIPSTINSLAIHEFQNFERNISKMLKHIGIW